MTLIGILASFGYYSAIDKIYYDLDNLNMSPQSIQETQSQYYTKYDSGNILENTKYPTDFIPLYKRDIYRLESALDIYDSYIALKICINKIKNDVKHSLWLPNEIWCHIIKNIKECIEHFNMNNKHNTTLYELEIYKQEFKLIKENPKNINNKGKFRKIINTKKQIRIDNYKRKIYTY